jgi:hypothetical protein
MHAQFGVTLRQLHSPSALSVPQLVVEARLLVPGPRSISNDGPCGISFRVCCVARPRAVAADVHTTSIPAPTNYGLRKVERVNEVSAQRATGWCSGYRVFYSSTSHERGSFTLLVSSASRGPNAAAGRSHHPTARYCGLSTKIRARQKIGKSMSPMDAHSPIFLRQSRKLHALSDCLT